jgi:hypothetical protein
MLKRWRCLMYTNRTFSYFASIYYLSIHFSADRTRHTYLYSFLLFIEVAANMFDGPLQWIFMFGILQHGSKMPVNLKFRPQLNYRVFYHTVDTLHDLSDMERIIKRRDIESVEQVVAIKKTMIHINNINVELDPANSSEWHLLIKRPYFDRLLEGEVPGDFRSREHPYGYAWMLFPTPESLMTPDQNFYEGQKWGIKMIGGSFEMNYELTNVDHEKHQATIEGRNGVCLNGSAGNKRWNGTWIIDTRTGIIKRMHLQVDHQIEQFKQTTRLKITKVLMREEADSEKIFDYEVDGGDRQEL